MNDIENKIDEFFSEIKSSEAYVKYLDVKKQVEQNEDIMNILRKIKRLQKIATNNNDDEVEKEIKKLYDSLNNIPLYQSYLISFDMLNEELYNIKEIFEKYFKDILKLE